MRVRVLGSAAGGGFPQWNCACSGCGAVRDGSRPTCPRTQSSIAVSTGDRRWFLFNASPDICAQIESFPPLHPSGGSQGGRAVPLHAVLLTDAELDHTLGLLLLRNGRGLQLHATEAVRDTLDHGTSLLQTLEACCPIDWRPVIPEADVPLADGLWYRAFDVPTTKQSPFALGTPKGRVVGYRLTDEHSGRTLVYLPSAQELATVLDQLEDCSCLLVDGTCWYDDELKRLGLAGKTSREMGHLPIHGPDGSLALLAPLAIQRTIYIHINNTNPILLDDSPERRIVEQNGMEVAVDGMELRI